MSADAGDVQAISWSPDGAWIACQLAPFGGERTRVRLVSPDGAEIRDIAPGAAAVTLGVWSPGGRQLGVTVFPRGRRRRPGLPGRPARRHLDGARRRPGRPGLRGQRRRPAGRGPARPARRPPAGAGRPVERPAHRAAARRRRQRGRRPVRRHRPPALRAHRRRPRAPGAARRHPARQRRGVQRLPDRRAPRRRPRPGRARPERGARRAGLERATGAARSSCSTCAPALLEPLAGRRPARWSPGRRSPGTRGRCWSPSEGPTVPPRLCRIAAWTSRHRADPAAGRASPSTVDALVSPTLHTSPARTGCALSGWLFRPRGALGPLPTLLWLHGGPEAQERPTFQPLFQALVAEGVAVFAPNVRGSGGYGRTFAAADDLRPPVRRDHRRAGRGRLPGLRRAGRPGPGRGVRALLRRLPDAGRAGLVPRAVRGRRGRVRDLRLRHVLRPRPSRGSPRRPSPSTATRTPTPRCCASCPRSTTWTGSPRRCWWCTARTTPTCRWSRPSRWWSALRERGAAPGFLLFPDEGHEVHGTENRAVFVREVVRWVTAHLLELGVQTA